MAGRSSSRWPQPTRRRNVEIDRLHSRSRRIGIHHHAIVPAAFVKIRLPERCRSRPESPPGGHSSAPRSQSPEAGSAVAICQPGRDIGESHFAWDKPRPSTGYIRISARLKKACCGIQLRAEGAGLVSEDFVFNLALRAAPLTCHRLLSSLRTASGLSVFGLGPHPVHVLRKIANLVKRVPDRQLQIAFGRARRREKSYFHQMLRPHRPAKPRNGPAGVRQSRRRDSALPPGIATSATNPARTSTRVRLWRVGSRFGGRLQRMVARSASGH